MGVYVREARVYLVYGLGIVIWIRGEFSFWFYLVYGRLKNVLFSC